MKRSLPRSSAHEMTPPRLMHPIQLLPSLGRTRPSTPAVRPIPNHPVHKRNVIKLRLPAVGLHVRPAVGGHDLDQLLDDLVRDERVAQVHLGDVGLAVGDLAEALEDLLGRVLVLGHVHHEADELLEGDAVAPARGVEEVVVHLVLGEDEAERGERGAEFELGQAVGVVAVEVAEDGLELLELDGGQVGHVARDHLVLEEGELLGHGGLGQGELVAELVVRVGGEVVFFDVGFLALGVDRRDGLEEGVQGWEVVGQLAHVVELVFYVAFQAGDGELDGVERERKVVGLVGEGLS